MSDSTIPQLEEKGPFETGPSTKQPLQPQAQHPPPPPPLPFPSASQPNDNSSTPSASLSSSKPVWPNGFLLYLDPLATQTNLRLNENLSTLTNGNPPQITSNLFEPTHFVLDPESKFGDVVLQLASSSSSSSPARLPLLVTYQWLKQCIMWSSWEPEEDFLFVDAKEDLKRRREERAKGKGREEDEEEEMEGFGEDEDGSHTEERTSGKLPNLPTVGRWLDSENDALARFLLPLENYTRRDQNGRDAFDRFARTEHTRRSGAACREHHRNWKDKFDSRMDTLRGGNGKGRAKEESKQWDGERKGKEKEKQVSKRAQTFSNTESARPPRPTYTDQEESDFQTCLKTSRTSLEAAEKMFALHPRRNVLSIEHRYRRKISEYQDLLGSGDATGTPTVASEFSSNLNPSRKHQHQHQQQPQSSTSAPIHHSQNQTPLDSDSDSEFEPPSFLQLGVAPSSLPSSSPFCFWCGTGEEESEYFRALGLAEQDPSSSQGFRRVEGRVACSFCFERTERWMGRGDGSGREMGELEKLDWTRKKLEHQGRKERASLVRRRDGGTAAEG